MNKRVQKMTENKEKLIAIARKIFAEQGFAGASMDAITAEAGLTRGALYHSFGDKKGLLAAVVNQIDTEMALYAHEQAQKMDEPWLALLAEGEAYIRKALDPEVQQIVLRDGPSVLGDPSQWPSQNQCLAATKASLQKLQQAGLVKKLDLESTAVLVNGAALNAALYVASREQPEAILQQTVDTFKALATGLLVENCYQGI